MKSIFAIFALHDCGDDARGIGRASRAQRRQGGYVRQMQDRREHEVNGTLPGLSWAHGIRHLRQE